MGTGRNSTALYHRLLITLVVSLAFAAVCAGQVAIPTSRSDNQRTGANVNETLLTPSNVNKNQFGALFSYPIDYQALAQPLYIPNVNIPGQGTHNVVYVATMADSVYAFDADSNTGSPLWWVNFTDPANGITTASGANLPCSGNGTGFTGFTQEGIAGTPTIDTTTGTMYVVAKTVENGTVRHRLHALDITTGQEKFGGPTLISANSTSNLGHFANFNSLHQLNRPGLLLLNGYLYMGFGSNGCNDSNTGWLLAYNASNLQQAGSFNTSPDVGLTSIWQTGNGIAADELGNVYAVTAESPPNDPGDTVPMGGQSYCHSVLEFNNNPSLQNSLSVADYFIPSVFSFLNTHDLDLSSGGTVILPDQDGPWPHILVISGKQGTIYVLNRDNLGQYSAGGDNILQELPFVVGHMFNSPAYWNGTLYYAGDADTLKAFALTPDGQYPLSTAPVMASAQKLIGSHSPSISANGNTNGIVWVMSGSNLYAYNASTLQQLYISSQLKARDALPATAHFVTQTIANGKVYVATQTTLSVYGLFQDMALVSGSNQSGPVLTTLPAPIVMQVTDPYSGAGIPGVTVSFSDGGKNGTFNPPSGVSDSNGNVSTTYTFAKTAGVYTIAASSAKSASLSFTETALPGPATKIINFSGNKQTGQAGSILPNQLRVKVEDAYANGVPGVTATYTDQGHGGTLTPTSSVSNASGFAMVSYQVPNIAGTYKLLVSGQGVPKGTQFTEYATGDAPANLVVVSGGNQSAPVNTPLPQPLVVQVTDQGGNPIAGVSVTFSAPSGSFTGAPATTDSNGSVSVNYTTGSSPGPVTITAAVNGLSAQIGENVTGALAMVTVAGGNNQF